MKNLLALVPFSLVLAACASGPVHQQPVHTNTSHTTAHSHSFNKAYDRAMPEMFTCEDDATVQAKYSVDGQQAMVTASLPKLQWNNQTVVLDIDVSGSGARYVNKVSPEAMYDWHTKADTGIMTVNWADGTTYSVICERR